MRVSLYAGTAYFRAKTAVTFAVTDSCAGRMEVPGAGGGGGGGGGGGALSNSMDRMLVLPTVINAPTLAPTAFASISALCFALRMAAPRALSSNSSRLLISNTTLFDVFAPAFAAASMIAPTFVRSDTVTVRLLVTS